ncbi:Ent-kaurene oxidase [Ophiocordyceps camponoti-floridani]|uniref:Ent-kaurene oxidase n=1 Tax=Ophiocordyceps camponoti-floridani TaxID=2030778 RepID=A0A8H4QDU4_9HYPO|nr:Ent-kaurene oxidase [Ophiocordyceps camponoti-floridani]
MIRLAISEQKPWLLDPAHGPSDGLGWSKPALQSPIRLDSSIRESRRLSNFSDTLLERVVASPAGLVLPRSDCVLPPGIHLTVNLEGAHHDESLYRNALAYNPLRYARLRRRWQWSVPATDMSPFGHGRHACPGRFFVAHELKLITAYLLRNYVFRLGGGGGEASATLDWAAYRATDGGLYRGEEEEEEEEEEQGGHACLLRVFDSLCDLLSRLIFIRMRRFGLRTSRDKLILG